MRVKSFRLLLLVLTISLTVSLIASLFTGCSLGEDKQDKKIIINEVMTSNKSALKDGDGDYSDWIELYNNTDEDINLDGYSLSDSKYNAAKWKFPDVTIKAGSYLIIFASGKDKVEENGICHTNYKLSSNGETLVLSSRSVSSIDSIEIPSLETDISYGRVEDGEDKDSYGKLISATPGTQNSGKRLDSSDGTQQPGATADPGSQTSLPVGSGEILINEYMSRNSYLTYDEDGDYSDWVELYNTTDADIDLTGYFLTTKASDLQKWAFPSGIIKAKSYLVVWLSGKNKVTEKGQIHASFKLGENDPSIILSSNEGAVIDSAKCLYLPDNVSYGRSISDSSKWVYYAKPTPGKTNNTTEFTELSSANSLKAKGLWVNEVSSVSQPYNDKQVSDWIEIYNGTGETVDLNGYGLSIDTADKYAFKFGNINIKAGEFLLVYAAGTDVPSNYVSKIHTKFKLSSKGDTVYFTDPGGITIDAFQTGRLTQGYTSGRVGEENAARYFFTEPTPGAANTKKGYVTYTVKPEISNEGGYVPSGTAVTISVPEGAVVYYTTDGSEPTVDSKQYNGNITINETVVIKARAFANDLLPSNTITASYVVEKQHTVPVVSISIKEDDFSGNKNGIYANGPGYTDVFPHLNANYWQDWERKITFEYYDEKGVKQLQFDAGMKIFGQYTRTYDQKSMSINLRGDYGNKSITYPFFKDNKFTTNSNFVLRAGGQDYRRTIIRDPFCSQVMKGNTGLAFMDWQPVILYINGRYCGLYSLREKINESYLQTHYGIDKDKVDIIKGNSEVLEGSFENYKSLLDYVKTHDLSKTEYYTVVEKWVDIDNYIDYLISTIYFANIDSGNVKFYRERKEGAKWQWVMFDFDMALRMEDDRSKDSISKLFDPAGHGTGKMFSAALQTALLKNETFKNRFIEKYAYHLNNTFKADRMSNILDQMVTQIDKEIPGHIAKWGKTESYETWKGEINTLKGYINGRRKVVLNELFKCRYFNISDAQMKQLFSDWDSLKA